MSHKIQDNLTDLPLSPQYKSYLRNKEKRNAYNREQYKLLKQDPHKLRHLRDLQNSSRRKRHLTARQLLIERLGSTCKVCGFTDWRALQIDHVFGDGYLERQKDRSMNPLDDKKKIRDGFESGKYQLLCANCNWIKRYEQREDGRKQRLEALNSCR